VRPPRSIALRRTGLAAGALCLAASLLPAFGARAAEPKSQASLIEVGEDRPVFGEGPEAPLVEPHLAVHPIRSDQLAAAAIVVTKPDISATDCATFASSDGGKTWSRRDLGLSTCGDPWLAFTQDGTLVLAVLTEEDLLVYRSSDGGRTWPDKPVSLGQGHDHETLALDRTKGRFAGSLYVVSNQGAMEEATGKNRSTAFVARSNDGGRSFAEPGRLFPSNLSTNTMTGVVLSDGMLAVSFTDYQRPGLSGPVWLEPGRSWLTTSGDGGRTLSAPMLIGQACGRSFPSLAADESTGPFRDRLYWVCNGRADGLTPNPDFERVAIQYSPDRGERWSEPTAVNSGSGRRPYVRTPAIAVNRDGVVGVSWYDGRNERQRFKGIYQCQDLYFAASLDGGESFLPEVKVSSASSCPDQPGNGTARYRWPAGGDYHGLAARPDGLFQLVWADSRDSIYRLRTATVKVSGKAAEKE
jgi:hypothetical protein